MISSELPEIIGMSDRALVMCNGRITANSPARNCTAPMPRKPLLLRHRLASMEWIPSHSGKNGLPVQLDKRECLRWQLRPQHEGLSESELRATPGRMLRRVIRTNEFALLMVLLVGCVLVTLKNPRFLSLSNIGTLGRDIAMIGIWR